MSAGSRLQIVLKSGQDKAINKNQTMIFNECEVK